SPSYFLSYVGDVEINVEVKRYFCKAGVKGIQLHGMMRVILEPLIGDVPIVGAVTMFFIQRPKLTINWTGLTNLLDIPGVNMMSDTMIMDAIASFLVLPNRLTVPLVADLHVAQLRSPLPRGVVRIHLVEAESLAAKDTIVSGVSDPYALLRVGPQTFKSQHLDNTLNPKWGEMYEVIVHEVPGQELEVEVFDKDPDQDDFLGRTKLDLGIVKKSKIVDEWFTLKDTPTGRVHLRLEWLTLEADTGRLTEVLKRNESVVSKTAKPPSAAIMALYLDKAEALPMKKGNKDPNPIAQISVQDVTRDSRICWNTVNPQWEDAFTFFIRDPSKENISVQVKDNDRVQVLGSLSIPVSHLLSSPDLTLDQWFNLENSGSESRIHINTVLRVLCLDESAVTSSLLSSGPLSKSSASRPQKTTPHSSFASEGLLRIHLVEAQNLVAKDNLMGGMVKGKSDPYVKIQIGGETFKSQVIKENLNPTWNEMYEVVLTQLPGQDLTLEVFDKDMDMKDDFMGRLKMNLSDIISSQYINEWFSLSDVKRGRVHLALEWLPTVTQPEKLQQVLLYQSKTSYTNKTVPSAALLFVYVERAHELPLKKSGKEPKVGVELILRGTSHRTTVCDRNSSPQWDEAFHFLVRNPFNEDLVVKLSHNWDFSLGSVVIPIKELLSEPDLLLDQWLNLDGASPQSQILLRAQLKILCPKATESSEDQHENLSSEASSIRRKQEEELVQKSSIEEVPPSPVSRTSSVSVPEEEEFPEVTEVSSSDDLRPLHTSPDPCFGTEGVLRLHLLEAQDLVAKDNMMGGMVKGKSDPYVKIHIGETTFKSHVIKENLNPTWNEMYEMILSPDHNLEVKFEVYDKDVDSDDFLGRFKLKLGGIIRSQYNDEWFTLNEIKHGRVHLVLEWLPTTTQRDRLEQVMQMQSTQSYQNKSVPSAAMLFILLERAHELPLKKSGKEPKAAAELVLGGTSYKTKVCDRSTSPHWNEAFDFLVHDPKKDILVIKTVLMGDLGLAAISHVTVQGHHVTGSPANACVLLERLENVVKKSVWRVTGALDVRKRVCPVCPAGRFGVGCQLRCVCDNGGGCDPVTGRCSCPPGWTGHGCRKACDAGRWGLGCASVCDCGNSGGVCDAQTGRCQCEAGFTGPRCDQICPAGWFGSGCSQRCDCRNGGVCDSVSGNCSCGLGWTGSHCEKECPAGWFGPDCALQCSCVNNSTCDRVTGSCRCEAGYYGHLCEHVCPAGVFGPRCQHRCDCVNGASCLPRTGQCVCPVGLHGSRCERECERGLFGLNCSQSCDCAGHAPCDPVSGRCICPSGKTGVRCDSDCSVNRYGPDCALACQCENGSQCDSRNGRCVCLNGWIGLTCSERETPELDSRSVEESQSQLNSS
ncbi:extended synaptotagmin-1, partial [Pimephales promelas]